MNIRHVILSSCLLSGVALGASTVFQATVVAHNEPSISEANALHFGTILNTTGSACALDSTGTVTGSCAGTDASIAVGVIDISGLVENQQYQIEVVGSNNGVLKFQPAITIDSVETTDDDDDQVVSVLTTQSGSSTSITIYGNLEVLSALQTSNTYQASYTVNVNFQ